MGRVKGKIGVTVKRRGGLRERGKGGVLRGKVRELGC